MTLWRTDKETGAVTTRDLDKELPWLAKYICAEPEYLRSKLLRGEVVVTLYATWRLEHP